MHLNFRELTLGALVALSCANCLYAQTSAAPGGRPAARMAQQPQQQSQRREIQPASGARPAVQPQAGNAQAPAVNAPAAERRLPQAPGQLQAGVARPDVAPRAPFVLTQQQEQLLEGILAKWEIQSDKVKTFTCGFSRWEIDPAFGPKNNDFVKSEGRGTIKFKAPDHGYYRVTDLKEWNSQKNVYEGQTVGLDYWVCDGKSIFEFDAKNKKLIERQLPPHLQGKAIANGPLPFIFGAKAAQLKNRYWMRDVTPKEDVEKLIWLEAVPKYQQDAANFSNATVILTKNDFIPTALRIIMPDGKTKTDYAFDSSKVNNPLSILKGDFLPPITPLGWQKVVEPAEGEPEAPPADEATQARRAPQQPVRK